MNVYLCAHSCFHHPVQRTDSFPLPLEVRSQHWGGKGGQRAASSRDVPRIETTCNLAGRTGGTRDMITVGEKAGWEILEPWVPRWRCWVLSWLFQVNRVTRMPFPLFCRYGAILPVVLRSVSGLKYYICFRVWLLSASFTFFRFIHVVMCINNSLVVLALFLLYFFIYLNPIN